jgi:hypothetical protein
MLKYVSLAAAACLVAAPLHGQQADRAAVARAPLYQITPYAGYMVFGDMLRGPVGTSLSSANGAVYGAQLGVNLTRHISVVGNVARAGADMQVGIPFLGGLSVGTSTAWLYDGGLQLSLPASDRSMLPVRPFVQVGAGAIQYDVQTGPVSVKSTNFAGNAGVGADIAFTPNFGARLMAKDYIGKFDIQEATQIPVEGRLSHNLAFSAGITLGF